MKKGVMYIIIKNFILKLAFAFIYITIDVHLC
jgi:hypothetical protein